MEETKIELQLIKLSEIQSQEVSWLWFPSIPYGKLTIKCVQLMEQSRKLTAKVDGQQKQISRLTDKVMEQSDTIDRLQEKVSDLGRLERHLGREQVQSIVERSKVLEQAERVNKRPKRAFEMGR